MSAIFDELVRINKLHAYCVTGDERHLKDMPPMPSLSLQAQAAEDFLRTGEMAFDIHDDALMRDCIGGRLTKSVQALLVTLEQWDTIPREAIPDMLKLELMKLRAAVKESFEDL